VGVWACIFFFFIHFNGFAVQETITTPLVQDWFGWDRMKANLLFTAAGVANLLCSVVMSYLSSPRPSATRTGTQFVQLVSDRTLLAWSMLLGAAGWLLLIPARHMPWNPMGWQLQPDVGEFCAAFGLVTVAFPFGRGVCLSMAGKLLGDSPQGGWMGIMFALGSVARIIGPFWAVRGYELGTFVLFGVTGSGFLFSLIALWALWDVLAPEAVRATELLDRPKFVASPYKSPLASPFSPSLATRVSLSEVPPIKLDVPYLGP